MIAQVATTLHGTLLSTGEFLIWGVGEQGSPISTQRLKMQLFAWDSRSFYGTMIESSMRDDRSGLILSPLTALHFFASPSPLLHGTIEWDQELLVVQEAAQLFHETFIHGWFSPCFHSWKIGQQRWVLRLPESIESSWQSILRKADQHGIGYLEEWFETMVIEMLRKQPQVAEAWERILLEHPLMQSRLMHPESTINYEWLDEDQWFTSIGWKQDDVPFRTCIQLVEPEDEGVWQLRLILQDKEDPSMLVETDLSGRQLEDRFPDHWLASVEDQVRRDAVKFPLILPWLDTESSSLSFLAELDDDQAWEFMNDGSLQLIQAGYSVFLPTWWEEMRSLKPRLKAKIKSSVGSKGNPLFSLNHLIQYDWKVAVGDLDLSEEEFALLTAEKRRIMRIRGRWIQLDPDFVSHVRQTMKRTQKTKGLSFREVLELHMLETGKEAARDMNSSKDPQSPDATETNFQFEVELNSHLRQFMKKLQDTTNVPLVAPPANLDAELRHYQQQGVSWLLFLRQFGLGACLADDMGLGKTIQFIAYLLSARKESVSAPALLICPTSVLGNWQKELQRFAPALRVHLHYGLQRDKGDSFTEGIGEFDLVITSYTLGHLDHAELSSIKWDTICLDEAQNIKNAYTKQSAAIRKLDAFHRIALTGTPIENRLTELWSIFDFLNPGYLGSLRAFSQKYANEIEKNNDPLLIDQIQKLVRPFLLRRVKKDPAIQLDLPDKNEMKTYVSLTAEQGAMYENVVQDLFDRLESLSGMEKRGMILATLTKLKQICNHPAHFLKETGNRNWHDRSQKVTLLLEMIQELRENGHKCLIFTQFVEMGHLLQAILEEERSEEVLFLHGGVPKPKRDQMVDRFQDQSLPIEKQCGIFILSLKAGGTGLNLTAANHVFHFDRGWNPAVENQATDRAFRIGQTSDVQVYKFVTLGTLEERIDEMIERKQDLSQKIVGSGESWVTEMSTDDVRDMFALRKEWIGKEE